MANGNIVVEVLIVLIITLFLAVVAQNKEVGSGEEATISCVVSGLTAALTGVNWKADGVLVTDPSISSDYDMVAGALDVDSQTTTLKVKATASTDTTYTCVITAAEWAKTDFETSVSLGVFGT